MLIALLIFRFYAIPQMRRYDKEVGLDSTWNRPTVERKNVGKWVTFAMVLLAILVILIDNGTIPFNASIIAKALLMLSRPVWASISYLCSSLAV